MSLKQKSRHALNLLLERFNQTIVDDRVLYDWQKGSFNATPGYKSVQLPSGAAEYLTISNARLADLRKRYARFNAAATSPAVWTDGLVSPEDMLYFRGDNAYVWQVRDRGMNTLSYALTTYYVPSIDQLGLMKTFEEAARVKLVVASFMQPSAVC